MCRRVSIFVYVGFFFDYFYFEKIKGKIFKNKNIIWVLFLGVERYIMFLESRVYEFVDWMK